MKRTWTTVGTEHTGNPQKIEAILSRLEWQKLRERNEALDCRVYARAAAWIAGADRWSVEKWTDLEDQLGVPAQDAEAAGMINRPSHPPTEKRRSDWLGRRNNWF